MKTVTLAFDIERTGAKSENTTIAIGLSVVNEDFQQLDSLLLKGYIPRPIPDTGAPPKGFEQRSWVEFWKDKQSHLEHFAISPIADVQESQRAMIIAFQEFRKKWERRAEQEGFVLQVCTDNPVYDGGYINEMIDTHVPEYHPLPYQARAVVYHPLCDTDSMLRGILAAVDPTFTGPWGLSARIRELYAVEVEDIEYDHLPHHDAYNIACDAQIVLGIQRGTITRRVSGWWPTWSSWRITQFSWVVLGGGLVFAFYNSKA